MIINSVLAANKIGCLDLRAKFTNDNLNKLKRKTRFKFFKQEDDKYVLKKDLFLEKLNKNWFKLDLKLRTEIKYINEDDYIDKELLMLLNVASKHIVNIKCLQMANIDDIMNLKFHDARNWQLYYDFDFIDKKSYLEYKLYNKLNLNPKVNILIGGLKTERCDSINLINKYYADQFNAPIIPKEDVKDLIKEAIPLFKGRFLPSYLLSLVLIIFKLFILFLIK